MKDDIGELEELGRLEELGILGRRVDDLRSALPCSSAALEAFERAVREHERAKVAAGEN